MQSFKLFETEMSKILYIRDHYKNTIYDVIKDKANLKNPQHYVFANDMIQDLEQMFGGFDKEGKADAELQNPKFAMRAKNAKETFDAFHTRFIATIAPLDMSEREKTDHLKRLIANRLKYRILDYPSSTSYRELVTRLRQVDLNVRLADEQSPKGTRGGATGETEGTEGTGSSSTRAGRDENNGGRYSNGTTTGRGGRYRHPQHVANRLRKENKCFKCLQPGHLPNEANASCREKSWLNEKQVTIMLTETGLETKADAPPTYE